MYKVASSIMCRPVLAFAIVALMFVAASAGDADSASERERLPTASDPYTFDSPVLDMKWVKDEKGKPTIVLLQTSSGYIHKSTDGGRNWQPLGDLLKPSAVVLPGKKSTSDKSHLIQKMWDL
jgi:photosystem II stability/assembly factor-like uncharacterized protein